MKKLSIALFICLVALGACSKSNPLVGTWKAQVPKEQEAMMKAAGATAPVLTFNSDGTFVVEMKMGAATNTMKGKYELKDKTATLTATETDGKPASAQDAKAETGTLSDDGKTFDMKGLKFVKT